MFARLLISVVLTITIITASPLHAQNSPASQPESTPTLDELSKVLAELEIQEMNKELETWTDPALIQEFSRIEITEDYVKGLYDEFLVTIVEPPDPDTYREYGIENGEEKLKKVTMLGKKIHNLLFALAEETAEKYGYLLQAMRDVLLIDARHIPLAIRHDNSRDVYWYELHNTWLERAEMEYSQIFDVTGTKVDQSDIHYPLYAIT